MEGLAFPAALGGMDGLALPDALGGIDGLPLPAGCLGRLLEGSASAFLALAEGAAVAVVGVVPLPLPEDSVASAWPLLAMGAAGAVGLTGEGAPLPAVGMAGAGSACCCWLTVGAEGFPEAL